MTSGVRNRWDLIGKLGATLHGEVSARLQRGGPGVVSAQKDETTKGMWRTSQG